MSKKKSNATKMALKTTNGVLHIMVNIIFYLLVILLVIKLGSVTYQYAYQIMGDVTVDAAPGKDVEVTISEADTEKTIANKLEVSKVIVNHNTFYIRLKLLKYSKVYPGTYLLNTSMTYDEILAVITADPEKKEAIAPGIFLYLGDRI